MKLHHRVVILAAGESRRMGTSKQMLIVDNETLLEKAISTACSAHVESVTVILGANAEQHKAMIGNLGVDVVINDQWRRGIGTSIKAGIDHLIKAYRGCDSALIMACDQPNLTTGHLNNMIKQYELAGGIVASAYGATNGIPVLFGRGIFGELTRIDDTEGAKKLLKKFSDRLTLVDFPGGDTDLDTPDDYLKFTNRKR